MLAANYVDVEQQSPEWMEMRKGMVTGSMVRHAIAKLASQPSLAKKCEEGKHETCAARHCNCKCHGKRTWYQQCREDYMIDIVTTRLTGLMSSRYVTKAMEEGIEREPDALMAYESLTGEMIVPGGFVLHPEINWYGTSPDGLVGDDIVIEAKCPTQATHMRYIFESQEAKMNGLPYVPEEYIPQVKAHLSCSGRKMAHFISFHPDFPKNLRLLVTEWPADRGAIADQDNEVRKFLDDANTLEESMRSLNL